MPSHAGVGLSVSVELHSVLPFRHMQTTNLLLQAGDEALRTAPASIASLTPLKCAAQDCKDEWSLHRFY